MPVPKPSDKLVELSLEAARSLAEVVVPIVEEAHKLAVADVTNPPPGGARFESAELQLLPAVLRLRMHQLLQGFSAADHDGVDAIGRRHVRNGAVCLVAKGVETRMLKKSVKYPTRRTGVHQARLITQEDYKRRYEQPRLDFGPDERPLGALIYWVANGFELVGAHLVIPYGFAPEGGVVELAREQVELGGDLAEAATFTGLSHADVTGGTLVSTDAVWAGDPFEESDPVEEIEAGGAAEGFIADPSVELGDEEAP